MTHIPVMPREVLEGLQPREDGSCLDCTAGLGGHAERIAKTGCRLTCVDRDAAALELCKARLEPFGQRITFIRGNYADYLQSCSEQFDGILLDLGVSSMQLDLPDRGFSYRTSAAPLDMRMDRTQPLTAEEIVNSWDHRRLVRLLYDYGEERYAPQIARGIVAARPLKTAGELCEAIVESMPARGRKEAQHPARRTFQALRIAVNDELNALEQALPRVIECLKPGGRGVCISFHSLEDRIVKRIFSQAAKGCVCPPGFPACVCGKQPIIKQLGKKKPLPDECGDNPRSASAVLRVIEKI